MSSLETVENKASRPECLRGTAVPEVALVVIGVVASMTLAGAGTPCVLSGPQPPGSWVADLPLPSLTTQCVGQIVLLNCLPSIIALLAASESRWRSGLYLLVLAVFGGALGLARTVAGDLGDVPLLAWPLLTSVVVILALRVEQGVRWLLRCRTAM